MARSKGDLTRSTFSALVLFLAGPDATDEKIGETFGKLNALCDAVAEGNADAESKLEEIRDAYEKASKGPKGKPGRKALIDKDAITAATLARYKKPDGTPMDVAYFAILPNGAQKTALKAQIDAAIANAKLAAMGANLPAAAE